MRIQAIIETAIYVDDLGKAEAFYKAVLGLPVLGTFTKRQRLAPTRALLAYGKMLPLVALLLAASVAPRVALGFDQLNPAYGQSLAVRDQNGKIIEILYPKHDRFIREGATGGTLGWAQRMGSNLAFFDRGGRQTSTASKELMPANYPLGAIAVVRDGFGTTIGIITRH